MNHTKIDWADMTWNPVSGCYHNCPYCYAAKFAKRFQCKDTECRRIQLSLVQETKQPIVKINKKDGAYPFGFVPTFHRYRLEEPLKRKKPQNIFVCSMADLFGEWVPDKWIKQVFEACMAAPKHRYLFLTKNPDRYDDFFRCWEAPENFYFGTTVVNDQQDFYRSGMNNAFLSIEPIQSDFSCDCLADTNWVIIGAETGNRKGKITPKREWVENIVNYCREKNVPVFIKSSLKDIWGEPLIQEYPWEKL